ncbi:hypothetical protein [Streptomyces lydicus]|uniref:hypothetical protein n=1 Tax=Streptomyces lydicus TaxID=47763 RepID=UPI003790CAD0
MPFPDFGLDSLELLEEIVRERFADGEEILAEKRSEFVQGGTLYPWGALNVLYWETDELDYPREGHLYDVLEEFG